MAFTNQLLHLLCFVLLVVVRHGASQFTSQPLDNESFSMRERHKRWMAHHGRVYKDAAEMEKRFNIFKENVKHIENFNSNGDNKKLYTLGVNAFTDLTTEEFRATYTGYKRQSPSALSTLGILNITKFRYENLEDVPPSVDWREKGAVTPVKFQENCGSCWAFAAVASVEGLHQINTGELIPLSVQEIVDCAQNAHGCHGGNVDLAFEFIQKNQGLATEEVYPYQGSQGQCQGSTMLSGSAVAIRGFEGVPQDDETALLQAVSQHPVSAAMNSDYIQHYAGGIFNGSYGAHLNLYVSIIGYGTDPTGIGYWLIKNSWGKQWGENGYARILRGQNLCHIASRASYPTI